MKYNTKLALGISALMLLSATFAFAAPTKTSAIYACLSSTGTLIKVSAKAPKCPKGTTAISWNQVGAQGIQGIAGVPGQKGDKGEKGESGKADPFFAYKIKSGSGSSYSVYKLPVMPDSRAIKVSGIYWMLNDSGEILALHDRLGAGWVVPVFQSLDCSGPRSYLTPPTSIDQLQYPLRNFSSSVSTTVYINAPYETLPPSVTGVAQPSSFTFGQVKSYLDATASCVGASDVTTAWNAFRSKVMSSASSNVIPTGTASFSTWSNFVRNCLATTSQIRFGCFTDSTSNLGGYKFVTHVLGLDETDMDSLPSIATDVARQLHFNTISLATVSPFNVLELTKPQPLGDWTYDLD
jgi:hypothetical protein